MNRLSVRLLALAFGLGIAVLAAEASLRISGRYSTYSERNYGEYRSVYGRRMPGWIHSYTPGITHQFKAAEFSYEYHINSDGVRDVAHAEAAEAGTQRIVVLGDSFTEGVGADQHEAWPAVLGELLARAGHRVEVFNAGMSGSDPFFAYQLLRQRMLRYGPDLVIVSINESDQTDTLWWGGMERFRDDGFSVGRPVPLGMWGYGYSHLWRFVLANFCRYDPNTMTFGDPVRRMWEAQVELIRAFEAMDALRAEHPFRLLVLTHPLPDNVVWKDSRFLRAFHDKLAERGIASADLGEALHAQLAGLGVDEYSWPIDKHYNARGYAAFARAVAGVLEGTDLAGRPWLDHE